MVIYIKYYYFVEVIYIYINILKEIILSNKLLEKYGITKIGIFGSTARGENGNDIDILVDEDISYKKLILFKKELEQLSNKKVDIMIKKYANPIVLYRAEKEIIYVA